MPNSTSIAEKLPWKRVGPLKERRKEPVSQTTQTEEFHGFTFWVTGSKVDQFDAARAMQREKNDGEYVFSAAEYLTGQQIAFILFTFKYERQVNGHSRFESISGREWEV